MRLEFQEYRARKIVNVHRHVHGPWFWGKYTAHPYVGCRSGCEFCYLRGSRYLGKRSLDTFDTLVQVKVNAVELLRKELLKLPPDIIASGDWQQPAEDRYQLSRGMLEVVKDFGFPLFVGERSPLLARDLDLLVDIHRRSWVGVMLSMSGLNATLKRTFEPRSPGVKRRLEAMRSLADAGIVVGTALMPVLPLVGDDDGALEDVVLATVDHGGTFVMGGGLTMDGPQADRALAAARTLDPGLEGRWRELYAWPPGGKPRFGPPRDYNARLGNRLRELCEKRGLKDHVPRYIAPGALAINKQIAERLFMKTYDLELQQVDDYKIHAYRRAAWTIDELGESVAHIYETQGEPGLLALPAIGRSLAREISSWLKQSPPGK